jgi:hypothetical protein
MGPADDELLSFDCPRCGRPATVEFYGPCPACVTQLRSVGGEARDVQVADYEPKMNVTPNQVATKD